MAEAYENQSNTEGNNGVTWGGILKGIAIGTALAAVATVAVAAGGPTIASWFQDPSDKGIMDGIGDGINRVSGWAQSALHGITGYDAKDFSSFTDTTREVAVSTSKIKIGDLGVTGVVKDIAHNAYNAATGDHWRMAGAAVAGSAVAGAAVGRWTERVGRKSETDSYVAAEEARAAARRAPDAPQMPS